MCFINKYETNKPKKNGNSLKINRKIYIYFVWWFFEFVFSSILLNQPIAI